jgi:hypothetical protein
MHVRSCFFIILSQISVSGLLVAAPGQTSSMPMPTGNICPQGWRSGPPSSKVCCAPVFIANLGWPNDGKAACKINDIPVMTAPHKIPCPQRPKPPGPLESFCAAFMSGINLGGASGKNPTGGNETAVSCTDEGFQKIYSIEKANYDHWVKCYGNLGCNGFEMQQQPFPPGCP